MSDNTAFAADSEALRRAVLLASWRRDRSVATRRLWWRWAQWVTARFLLPLAVLLAGIKLWAMYGPPGPQARMPSFVKPSVIDDLVPGRSENQGISMKPAHTYSNAVSNSTTATAVVVSAPAVPAASLNAALAPASMPAPSPAALEPFNEGPPVTLRLDWPAPPASKAPTPPASRKKPIGANRP